MHIRTEIQTIISFVVLYKCRTCCLTLRQAHRLRVLENMVLSQIFATKSGELSESWRKLCEKEIRELRFTVILSGRTGRGGLSMWP